MSCELEFVSPLVPRDGFAGGDPGDSPVRPGPKLSAVSVIASIEVARQQAGVSKRQLCATARLCDRSYRRMLRGERRPSPDLIARLSRALRQIKGEYKPVTAAPAMLLATYGGFLAVVAPHFQVTTDQIRANPPARRATADRTWQACAHARQASIYLVNTVLGVEQHQLARALEMTPAAICLAIRSVEDRREDPVFDALMARAERTITGREA